MSLFLMIPFDLYLKIKVRLSLLALKFRSAFWSHRCKVDAHFVKFCAVFGGDYDINFVFTFFLFLFLKTRTFFWTPEVYKHTIEGSITEPEKYGQEVRNAIRLSRLRVLRGRNRQKVLSERSKNKQFNYFHYP